MDNLGNYLDFFNIPIKIFELLHYVFCINLYIYIYIFFFFKLTKI
jgi:hypothetical protein